MNVEGAENGKWIIDQRSVSTERRNEQVFFTS
jgi:hypothetical protein